MAATIVGIVLIVLAFFGKYARPALAASYAYAKANTPKIGNPLAVKVELTLWQVLLVVAGFWVLSSGGVSLPSIGDWKWPSFSILGPSSGPRELLVVHETGDESPAKSALFIELRAGDAAKYLKEKQHSLLILDKDAKDESGNPAEPLAKFAPFTPPELLIIAPPNKLLSRQKMPATSADFLAAVKAKGG